MRTVVCHELCELHRVKRSKATIDRMTGDDYSCQSVVLTAFSSTEQSTPTSQALLFPPTPHTHTNCITAYRIYITYSLPWHLQQDQCNCRVQACRKSLEAHPTVPMSLKMSLPSSQNEQRNKHTTRVAFPSSLPLSMSHSHTCGFFVFLFFVLVVPLSPRWNSMDLVSVPDETHAGVVCSVGQGIFVVLYV